MGLLKKIKFFITAYFYIYAVAIVVIALLVTCFLFMKKYELQHLRTEVQNNIVDAHIGVKQYFFEHKLITANIADIIRSHSAYNVSSDTLQAYMDNYVQQLFDYNVKHEIVGIRRVSDTLSTDELWYKKAIEANGKIAFIEPAWDSTLNMIVVSYAINILDKNNKSLGILYVKFNCNNLINKVAQLQKNKGGFGILLNSELIIVAHPYPDFLGKQVKTLGTGIHVFFDDFKYHKEFSERHMLNYLDDESVAFCKLLDKDLYLVVVVPEATYYHNIYDMIVLLLFFAIIFIVIYAIMATHFLQAKEKEKMNAIIETKNRKLEETTHWYKSILNTLSIPISVTNTNMEWEFINTAAEEFGGYKLEDIKGKECSLWNLPCCNTQKCTIECAKRGINKTYFTRNGLSFQVHTESLKNLQGEIVSYVKILQDITEIQEMARKQANAEESERLKSAFLANMSHEIRTPLNAIVGFSHLLVRKKYDENKITMFVNQIKSNSDQLLIIIDDILDISKIESKQLILSYQWTNLNALLQEISDNMQLQINNKDVSLFCQKSLPDAEVYIKVDNIRLKQVLTNLIMNAIKFTSQGFVNFGYTLKNKHTLEFFVKDTGIGIAKENQKQIFEYFRQEDETTTRQFGGNGLGLSIAKQLVELMGGYIHVESEKGEGASFFFTIPYAVSQQPGAPTEEIPEENPVNSNELQNILLKDKKILIIDDVDSSFILISELLSESKTNLHYVNNGQAGIDFVKENPDTTLIFMDIYMPLMTGIEAMKHIKAINPDIPIVAQTAFAMKEDKDKFMNEGFDDYTAKPLRENELLRLFKRFVIGK